MEKREKNWFQYHCIHIPITPSSVKHHGRLECPVLPLPRFYFGNLPDKLALQVQTCVSSALQGCAHRDVLLHLVFLATAGRSCSATSMSLSSPHPTSVFPLICCSVFPNLIWCKLLEKSQQNQGESSVDRKVWILPGSVHLGNLFCVSGPMATDCSTRNHGVGQTGLPVEVSLKPLFQKAALQSSVGPRSA